MVAGATGRTCFVRPLQCGQGSSVLRAVLVCLLARRGWVEAKQVSISSGGRLDVANRILRTARSQQSEGKSDASFLALDSTSEAESKKEKESKPSNPLQDKEGDQDGGLMSYGQVWNMTTPEPPPTEYLMFNWDAGGAWNGNRNDLNAEVGFEFEPLMDLNLTAIGRHVAGRWDQLKTTGKALFEPTNVSLWFVLPKGTKLKEDMDKDNALLLVRTQVGPEDNVMAEGTYMFRDLDHPYELKAHETYRITQTCWAGMDDVWYDGCGVQTDVDQYALTECFKIGDGVHADYRGGYPDKLEHKYQRIGMLNLRVDSGDSYCGSAIPIAAKESWVR